MDPPIVTTKEETVGIFSIKNLKKNKQLTTVLAVVLICVVLYFCYCNKDSFISPDGVVASKASRKGVRSDSHVDKKWNLKELEKSVALLNEKASK